MLHTQTESSAVTPSSAVTRASHPSKEKVREVLQEILTAGAGEKSIKRAERYLRKVIPVSESREYYELMKNEVLGSNQDVDDGAACLWGIVKKSGPSCTTAYPDKGALVLDEGWKMVKLMAERYHQTKLKKTISPKKTGHPLPVSSATGTDTASASTSTYGGAAVDQGPDASTSGNSTSTSNSNTDKLPSTSSDANLAVDHFHSNSNNNADAQITDDELIKQENEEDTQAEDFADILRGSIYYTGGGTENNPIVLSDTEEYEDLDDLTQRRCLRCSLRPDDCDRRQPPCSQCLHLHPLTAAPFRRYDSPEPTTRTAGPLARTTNKSHQPKVAAPPSGSKKRNQCTRGGTSKHDPWRTLRYAQIARLGKIFQICLDRATRPRKVTLADKDYRGFFKTTVASANGYKIIAPREFAPWLAQPLLYWKPAERFNIIGLLLKDEVIKVLRSEEECETKVFSKEILIKKAFLGLDGWEEELGDTPYKERAIAGNRNSRSSIWPVPTPDSGNSSDTSDEPEKKRSRLQNSRRAPLGDEEPDFNSDNESNEGRRPEAISTEVPNSKGRPSTPNITTRSLRPRGQHKTSADPIGYPAKAARFSRPRQNKRNTEGHEASAPSSRQCHVPASEPAVDPMHPSQNPSIHGDAPDTPPVARRPVADLVGPEINTLNERISRIEDFGKDQTNEVLKQVIRDGADSLLPKLNTLNEFKEAEQTLENWHREFPEDARLLSKILVEKAEKVLPVTKE